MFLAAKSRWMIWKKEEENFIHFLGFDLRDVFWGILVLDKTQRHIELFKIKAQIIRVHGLKFRGDKFSKLQGVGSLNVEFYCIFIEESLKLAKFPQFDPLPLSRGEGVCDQTLRVHGGPCPPWTCMAQVPFTQTIRTLKTHKLGTTQYYCLSHPLFKKNCGMEFKNHKPYYP